MEGLLHRHVLMFGLIKPASKRREKVNVEINEWRNFAKTLVDCANFCIDLQIHTEELKLIFLVLYLVQVIEHPILQIPNFNFPNLRWYKMTSYIGIFGCIWYWFKTFIWKKYSKCKQTKYLGFVKLGVRWAEQDNLYIYTQHTTYPRFYIPLISWPLGGSAHCRNESRDTEDLTKPMLLAEKAMWISRLDCMLHLPWVAYQSFPRERYVSQRWNSLEIIKFDLLYR